MRRESDGVFMSLIVSYLLASYQYLERRNQWARRERGGWSATDGADEGDGRVAARGTGSVPVAGDDDQGARRLAALGAQAVGQVAGKAHTVVAFEQHGVLAEIDAHPAFQHENELVAGMVGDGAFAVAAHLHHHDRQA